MEEYVRRHIDGNTNKYARTFLAMTDLDLERIKYECGQVSKDKFIDEKKGTEVLICRLHDHSVLNIFTSSFISKPEDIGIGISDYNDGTKLTIRFSVLDATVDLEIYQDEIVIDCVDRRRFYERIFYGEDNKIYYQRQNEEEHTKDYDDEITCIMDEIATAMTLGLRLNNSKCIGNVESSLNFFAPAIRIVVEEIFMNYQKNKNSKEAAR